MGRHANTGFFDLSEATYAVQEELMAQFALGGFFEHPSACGALTEHHWLTLLRRYLPTRLSASPAFVIDSHGNRSRQIDIAIYDNFNFPVLLPHPAGPHLPIESIRAIFEVKPTISRQWMQDALDKAQSVRRMTRRPIPAGILATTSVWSYETFPKNVRSALREIPLDLGCALEHGSFTNTGRKVKTSIPEESLLFFIIHFLARLKVPKIHPYARHLEKRSGRRASA